MNQLIYEEYQKLIWNEPPVENRHKIFYHYIQYKVTDYSNKQIYDLKYKLLYLFEIKSDMI